MAKLSVIAASRLRVNKLWYIPPIIFCSRIEKRKGVNFSLAECLIRTGWCRRQRHLDFSILAVSTNLNRYNTKYIKTKERQSWLPICETLEHLMNEKCVADLRETGCVFSSEHIVIVSWQNKAHARKEQVEMCKQIHCSKTDSHCL